MSIKNINVSNSHIALGNSNVTVGISSPQGQTGRCLACDKQFNTSRERIITVFQDKNFHISCFSCKLCRATLPQLSPLAVEDDDFPPPFQLCDGELYCLDCGHECHSCHDTITGVAIVSKGKYYHSKCVKCAHCQKKLRDDHHFPLDNTVICSACKYSMIERLETIKNSYTRPKEDNISSIPPDELVARLEEVLLSYYELKNLYSKAIEDTKDMKLSLIREKERRKRVEEKYKHLKEAQQAPQSAAPVTAGITPVKTDLSKLSVPRLSALSLAGSNLDLSSSFSNPIFVSNIGDDLLQLHDQREQLKKEIIDLNKQKKELNDHQSKSMTNISTNEPSSSSAQILKISSELDLISEQPKPKTTSTPTRQTPNQSNPNLSSLKSPVQQFFYSFSEPDVCSTLSAIPNQSSESMGSLNASKGTKPTSKQNSSVDVTTKKHVLHIQNYLKPVICEVCDAKIFGNELKCKTCGLKIHSKCADKSIVCNPSDQKPEVLLTPDQALAFDSRNIAAMLSAVEKAGLQTEGLYKKPGTTSQVSKILVQMPKGDHTALNKATALSAAMAVKLYLTEMKDPLIDSSQYVQLCNLRGISEIPKKLPKLKEIISLMHPIKKSILQSILEHIFKVAEYGASNKMSIENLTSAIAPSLIFSRDDADETGLHNGVDDTVKSGILSLMIAFHKEIF